jgi:hypothetical protein
MDYFILFKTKKYFIHRQNYDWVHADIYADEI